MEMRLFERKKYSLIQEMNLEFNNDLIIESF